MTIQEASILHNYWTKKLNATQISSDAFKIQLLSVQKYASILKEMIKPTTK